MMHRSLFDKIHKMGIDIINARRAELYQQFENTPKDTEVVTELIGINEYLNARKSMHLPCGAYDLPPSRSELIQQLRLALHLAESPSPENDVVEFEIGSTEFSFDFTEE